MFSRGKLDRFGDTVEQGASVPGTMASALQRCSFSLDGQEPVAARKNKRRASEDCMAMMMSQERFNEGIQQSFVFIAI